MVERTFFAITNDVLIDQVTGNGIINNSSTPNGREFIADVSPDYTAVTIDDTGGDPDTFEDGLSGSHIVVDGGGLVANGNGVESESFIEIQQVDAGGNLIPGTNVNLFVFSQNGDFSDIWGLAADAPIVAGARYRKIDGSNAGASTYADFVACFATGVMLRTPDGERAVETLSPGDRVWTTDNPAAEILWAGRATVPATGDLAPIHFEAGVIGDQPLTVSPEHRILIRDHAAELLFGAPEVLVAAKQLLALPGARRLSGGVVTYHHIMFDEHKLVLSNGALTESFYAAAHAATGLGAGARRELHRLFPELARGAPAHRRPAARILSRREARALSSMTAKAA